MQNLRALLGKWFLVFHRRHTPETHNMYCYKACDIRCMEDRLKKKCEGQMVEKMTRR